MLIEAKKRRLSSGSLAYASPGQDRMNAENERCLVSLQLGTPEDVTVRNRGALKAIQNVLS
jgi:hypothetical protein